MGVIANVKEDNTLKAIDDLLKINFSLTDEIDAKKIKETFDSFNTDFDKKTQELGQLMSDIIEQENNVKDWNNRINDYKDKIAQTKEKIGFAKFLPFVKRDLKKECRRMKKNVKALKRIKKKAERVILRKYIQYRFEEKKQKDILKNRKRCTKEIRMLTKDRKEEIKFVKNFEKNRYKILRKNPKNYEEIEEIINGIKQNGGKWSEDIGVTLKSAKKMMRRAARSKKDLSEYNVASENLEEVGENPEEVGENPEAVGKNPEAEEEQKEVLIPDLILDPGENDEKLRKARKANPWKEGLFVNLSESQTKSHRGESSKKSSQDLSDRDANESEENENFGIEH